MLLRLVIAFVLCSIAAFACWFILPRFGLDLPWWVPLLAYAPMAISVLMMKASEPPDNTPRNDAPPPDPEDTA